jgi:hypothetical protein
MSRFPGRCAGQMRKLHPAEEGMPVSLSRPTTAGREEVAAKLEGGEYVGGAVDGVTVAVYD